MASGPKTAVPHILPNRHCTCPVDVNRIYINRALSRIRTPRRVASQKIPSVSSSRSPALFVGKRSVASARQADGLNASGSETDVCVLVTVLGMPGSAAFTNARRKGSDPALSSRPANDKRELGSFLSEQKPRDAERGFEEGPHRRLEGANPGCRLRT
jgi:hypothetical protein